MYSILPPGITAFLSFPLHAVALTTPTGYRPRHFYHTHHRTDERAMRRCHRCCCCRRQIRLEQWFRCRHCPPRFVVIGTPRLAWRDRLLCARYHACESGACPLFYRLVEEWNSGGLLRYHSARPAALGGYRHARRLLQIAPRCALHTVADISALPSRRLFDAALRGLFTMSLSRQEVSTSPPPQ